MVKELVKINGAHKHNFSREMRTIREPNRNSGNKTRGIREKDFLQVHSPTNAK